MDVQDLTTVIACDKREAFAHGSASDEAIHLSACGAMDCFPALAMTEEISTGVIPGRAQREPGISLNNLEVPDRSASRPVRNDAHKKRRIP
ncbi:hypothetical protein [Bradyrhizobium paxllaeri]|uniref:hypothetical protein n=1 Tax=Bradyrhizobium paxllaeri TaxID=190148 RepID=UPI000810E1BD|nr:hypothetical protein [Bradyrhizobium paxllaeri]